MHDWENMGDLEMAIEEEYVTLWQQWADRRSASRRENLYERLRERRETYEILAMIFCGILVLSPLLWATMR